MVITVGHISGVGGHALADKQEKGLFGVSVKIGTWEVVAHRTGLDEKGFSSNMVCIG